MTPAVALCCAFLLAAVAAPAAARPHMASVAASSSSAAHWRPLKRDPEEAVPLDLRPLPNREKKDYWTRRRAAAPTTSSTSKEMHAYLHRNFRQEDAAAVVGDRDPALARFSTGDLRRILGLLEAWKVDPGMEITPKEESDLWRLIDAYFPDGGRAEHSRDYEKWPDYPAWTA